MELRPGLSALVTGGSNGIGRALALALAQKGIFITILDMSEDKGQKVASLAEQECAKFHPNFKNPLAMFIRCDVTNASDLEQAFRKHCKRYGGLDICINCAGIVTSIPVFKDKTDGSNSWRRTIGINLVALVDCTRLAIRAMLAAQKPGVVINIASGAGIQPFPGDPVYSASKGGVISFTRSLFPYKRRGIRVNAFSPMFVKTDMGGKANPELVDQFGGYLAMEMVVEGVFQLIMDDTKAGSCLLLTPSRGLEYWGTHDEEGKEKLPLPSSKLLCSFDPKSHVND